MKIKKAMVVVVSLSVIALAVVVLGAGLLEAAPPMTIITGGGIVQNNNSGGGDLLAIGGFVARATGQSSATGQIQARTTPADNPLQTLASLHGKVVCILNLGPGGVSGADVWEVRFKITHVGGDFNPLQVGTYGSLFVQDNGTPGTSDMADESFANPLEAACGKDGPFALEPVVAGNFTVHAGR